MAHARIARVPSVGEKKKERNVIRTPLQISTRRNSRQIETLFLNVAESARVCQGVN